MMFEEHIDHDHLQHLVFIRKYHVGLKFRIPSRHVSLLSYPSLSQKKDDKFMTKTYLKHIYVLARCAGYSKYTPITTIL